MGIGPSRRDIERCANMIRRGAPGDACAAFKHQFEIWHREEPSLALSDALACQHYWIDVRCWRCKRTAEIDLRRIRAEDDATLANIADRARCLYCGGTGRLLKLRD